MLLSITGELISDDLYPASQCSPSILLELPNDNDDDDVDYNNDDDSGDDECYQSKQKDRHMRARAYT